MPRREFKTNYKANESVSKHVKKMEEEFNKAVNEEAERCGTSDYIGIFSGRKLEDIRKALEKLEGLPLKFKTTADGGDLKLLRVRQFIKSQFNDSYIV